MGFGVVGLHRRAGGSNRSIWPGFRTLVPAVSRQRNAPWMESGRACVGRGPTGVNYSRKLRSPTYGAISLGSCDHLGSARALTWAYGRFGAHGGSAAVPVIPRCPPLDLVRSWCAE